jgi:hypothetical protein
MKTRVCKEDADEHVKAGEHREVVDRASQKGLPRIGFDKKEYVWNNLTPGPEYILANGTI